jgi:hypothetical protein
MGLDRQNVVVALPSNLVSMNNSGFQECLMVERCPFCELGFALEWVSKLTSCKHFYHYWCDAIHFNTLEKYIKSRCEEQMHEGSWSSAEIKKPWTSPISDYKPNSRAKSYLPKHKVPWKGITFILYFHCLHFIVCIVKLNMMCKV